MKKETYILGDPETTDRRCIVTKNVNGEKYVCEYDQFIAAGLESEEEPRTVTLTSNLRLEDTIMVASQLIARTIELTGEIEDKEARACAVNSIVEGMANMDKAVMPRLEKLVQDVFGD